MKDEALARAALDAMGDDLQQAAGYVHGRLRTADGNHFLVQATAAQKAELVQRMLGHPLDASGQRDVLMVLRSELGTGLAELLAALGPDGKERLGAALHGETARQVLAQTLGWQ